MLVASGNLKAARRLLSVGAIIGRELEFDLWLLASECDELTAIDSVEELTRQGLLVDKDGDIGYRFVHDTIRQVVYEGLSPLRRRRWHRRFRLRSKMRRRSEERWRKRKLIMWQVPPKGPSLRCRKR